MLFQPLSDTGNSPFVRIGRRMGAVEDAHLLKQNDGNSATFALTDIRSQLHEKGFDIAPLNVRARGPSEDQFQRSLMPSLHGSMVPQFSTFKMPGKDDKNKTASRPCAWQEDAK